MNRYVHFCHVRAAGTPAVPRRWAGRGVCWMGRGTQLAPRQYPAGGREVVCAGWVGVPSRYPTGTQPANGTRCLRPAGGT